MSEDNSLLKYNENLKGWASLTKLQLKHKMRELHAIDSGKGRSTLVSGVKQRDGEVNRIKFNFERYLVYLHKGAGRGHGGLKGGKWISKVNEANWLKSTRKEAGQFYTKTNPKSIGKMGKGKRIPKPWFNPVIDHQFPYLAEMIAEFSGESALANIEKIKIK